MTTTKAAMSASETASTTITERAVSLMPREANTQITTQPTRAMGSQSTERDTPACRNSAWANAAIPSTDTGGKTTYVPSSAHVVKNPVRGPSVLPTKA